VRERGLDDSCPGRMSHAMCEKTMKWIPYVTAQTCAMFEHRKPACLVYSDDFVPVRGETGLDYRTRRQWEKAGRMLKPGAKGVLMYPTVKKKHKKYRYYLEEETLPMAEEVSFIPVDVLVNGESCSSLRSAKDRLDDLFLSKLEEYMRTYGEKKDLDGVVWLELSLTGIVNFRWCADDMPEGYFAKSLSFYPEEQEYVLEVAPFWVSDGDEGSVWYIENEEFLNDGCYFYEIVSEMEEYFEGGRGVVGSGASESSGDE
jgi:hypothetical protein